MKSTFILLFALVGFFAPAYSIMANEPTQEEIKESTDQVQETENKDTSEKKADTGSTEEEPDCE